MADRVSGPEREDVFPGRDDTVSTLAEMRSGNLVVRLAECEAEIRAAQRLRYRVFFEEKDARAAPEVARAQRDFDRYDAVADHLIAIDTRETEPQRAVVGAYRLIRREASRRTGGFYSAEEFDLSRFDAWTGSVLELGRSCVNPGHRNGRAISLLWRGIVEYADMYGIDLLFGCGSLPGVDPDQLALQLSYLHYYHRAPLYIRPRAVASRYVDMNRMPKAAIDPARGLASLPPLIKGYLRIGGFVGDGAVVDADFGCTDVCVVMKTDLMTGRYARHYGVSQDACDAA